MEILFLLQRHVNDPSLSRVQNTKRKRHAILTNMSRGKLRHRVQLSLSSLSESFGVDDESMLTIEAPSHDLKENDFECIQHLAILSEGEMRVGSVQIQQTSFVRPLTRNLKIKTHVLYDLRQEFFGAFASLVHIHRLASD
jgi:hypothetical protein